MAKLRYRPDIDGLRAIAVGAVMGFHAFPRWIPGGFIGVDVFFVISGFLITLVILEDLAGGKFSFANFYARRIRRIFPALLVLLAACLLVGWLSFFGSEFRLLGKDVAGGAAFVFNYVLLASSGYFATASESRPLLHLWSLAIEEQFYIVWPLLLYLASKLRTNLLWVLLAITVGSFALNLRINAASDAAFYLPWARAWELGAGGSLALVLAFRRAPVNRVAREAMAAGGLLLIFAAIFLLDSSHTYPGVLTIAPVAGALLLIIAGSDAFLNRWVLANRLLVGIGLISYSLYLWHWPLLSIAHIMRGSRPAPATRVFLLLLSVALAVLTWRTIERPARFGARLGMKAYALVALMLAVGCAGLAASSGSIRSLSEDRGIDTNAARRLLAASADWDFPGRDWHPVTSGNSTFVAYRGTKDQRVVWFFGDSEVEQYGPRVQKRIAAHPEQFSSAVFATKGGCEPLPNLVRKGAEHMCDGFFDSALAYGRGEAVSTAVIGAAWPYLFDGEHYRYTKARRGETADEIGEALYAEIEWLLRDLRARGKTVYLLLPIPMGVALDPARMISRRPSLESFPVAFTFSKPAGIPEDADAATTALRNRLRAVAAASGAKIIDPYDVLCPHRLCRAFDDHGEPVYKDESHLRAAFVREQASFIDPVLEH